MGLYSSFEDKWYDFWEKTPLIRVVDSIDSIVPSLILFIVFILLLLSFGTYFLFTQSSSITSVGLIVTVLGASENPLSGANVEYMQNCDNTPGNSNIQKNEVITNTAGKVNFSVCPNAMVVGLIVTKEGYTSVNSSIVLDSEMQKTIILSKSLAPVLSAIVKVTDEESKIISLATLDLICIKTGKATKKSILSKSGRQTQSDAGFLIDFSADCDTMNLVAKAPDFEDKTVAISTLDSQKIINLQKIVQIGTINFIADSPIGKQAGAEISINDYLGESQTLITLNNGEVNQELSAGNYTYTAVARGTTKTGSFVVIADKVIDVPIYFGGISNYDLNLLNAYIKPVDAEKNSVLMGHARIFYESGNDTNYFRALSASISGLIGPAQIADTTGKTFKAVVSVAGYAKKVVVLELKPISDSPQVVTLEKTGWKLSVLVVDDQNHPIANAVTKIFLQGFGGSLEESRLTDKNGNILFEGLSKGNYTITTQTSLNAGQGNVTIFGSDQSLVIQTNFGTGTMNLNFISNQTLVNPTFFVQKKTSGGFEKINASEIVNSKSVKSAAGSQVNIIVNDPNYIPFESFVYGMTRETTNRNIYLMKQSDLPNQKPVQMILRKVLMTDPIVSTESTATVLSPGNTYYLLFDLVFNSQNAGSALVNSYFETDGSILFQAAKSIDSSSVQMSSKKQNMVIDSDIVLKDAKQVNVLISSIKGPKSIPVLLKVSLDKNLAIGSKKTIYWQASLGAEQSILYSKEFTIGDAFCIKDCPKVIFSSFIMNQSNLANASWVVADDSKINQLQLGDNYKIKVNATNLTDTDYKSVQLSLTLGNAAKKTYLSFDNNSAFVNLLVNFGPFAKSADLISELNPAATANSIEVNRALNTQNSVADALSTAIGNNSNIRFSIKSKSTLNIEISNGKNSAINEKVSYPVFVVSTYTKETANSSKVFGPAYWKATLKRGTTSSILYSGRSTNAKGIDILSFNATGLNSGDIIMFDAWNEANSIPAHLEVSVTNPFEINLAAPDCITVSFIKNGGRINVKDALVPFFELDSKSKGVIFINSSCAESRKIKIDSLLHLAPLGTDFSISPGAEQAISVDCQNALDQCNTLGAFPVTIYSGATQPTNIIAALDVVLKDQNSSLDLSNAIWDFSKVKSIIGKVTNKVYLGRKDFSLPLMSINKPGVQIDYFKPGMPQGTDVSLGVPQKINFKLKVNTIGLEGITYGRVIGEAFMAAYKDCTGTGNTFTPMESNMWCMVMAGSGDYSCTSPPYNFYTATGGAKLCKAVIQKFKDANSTSPVVTYSSIRDPTKTFDKLTSQERASIISEIIGQPVSAGSLKSEVKNSSSIHFATTPNPVSVATLPPAPYMTNGDSSSAMGTRGFAYMSWVDLPEPRGMDYNKWFYYVDYTTGKLSPSYSKEDGHSAYAIGFGYHGLGILGGIIGVDWSYLKFRPDGSCQGMFKFGSEFTEVKTPINEREATWSKDVEINAVKGTVVDLGTYDNSMAPLLWGAQNSSISKYSLTGNNQWSTASDVITGPQQGCLNNISDVRLCRNYIQMTGRMQSADRFCNKDINALDCENHVVYQLEPSGINPVTKMLYCDSSKYDSLKNNPQCKQIKLPIRSIVTIGYHSSKVLCENSLGYVSFDSVKDYNYPLPSASSPLVEFNNGGKAYSIIKKEDIPDGVRLFLKDGHVFAEYIGVYKGANGLVIDPPVIASPDIDFNATKLDGLKTGYAMLTVSDWAGDNKVSKKFQVKIIGGESNCQSSEGDEGVSGANFDQHLLYDWDFGSISDNQCDSTNLSYTYCDGAQFMISLAKKLNNILTAEQSGDLGEIAKQSSGYYYLIKDNYSKNLLQDFDEYYSRFLSDYVPLRDRMGIDKLIAAGRIKFILQNNGSASNSGALPNGGIYFVGINVSYDNNSSKVFVNLDGSPNATITITFTPYFETGSTNPLYEMPFDGELGRNTSTGAYARADYGVGANMAFSLNSKSNVLPVTSAGLKTINVRTTTDLATLSNGVVLSYGSSDITFSASQPTPVMMAITGDGNALTVGYSSISSDNSTLPARNWTKKASTIGDGCYDFEEENKLVYGETQSGNNHTLNWTNSYVPGKLYLTSTFYSPSSIGNSVAQLVPSNSRTTTLSSISGINGLNTGSALMLKYYDAAPSTTKDYATLQGMMNLVKKGDMCISKTIKQGKIKIWWNPSAINKLESMLNVPDESQCVGG
ncbi:MAG: carboxypeptidase-like regulatory domain-containing protein [archaeon]